MQRSGFWKNFSPAAGTPDRRRRRSGLAHSTGGPRMLRRFLAPVAVTITALLCIAADTPSPSPAGGTMSGPYTYDNLTLYLVHGPGTVKTDYLTLDEALAAKKVIVHETGDVN